jgi:hypothetical protein
VFFRLGELRRGDRIVIGQAGGVTRSFLVARVERRAKEALPVGRIWNRTRKPVLRLITCGGSFDRSTATTATMSSSMPAWSIDSVM